LDGLLGSNYVVGACRLSEEQPGFLEEELKREIFLSSKGICTFIEKEFDFKYTLEGLVLLLNRLGFIYKNKQIP